MNKTDSYAEVIDLLNGGSRFCIATHINPDGDGIGSMLAMKIALEGMGKEVVTYSSDPIPFSLEFLPRANEVVSSISDDDKFDAAIMVDCAEPKRAGKDFDKLVKRTKLAVVDHHLYNDLEDAVTCLDKNAASAGEVVWRLLDKMGVFFNETATTEIYTTLVVDTGFFKYSSTTSDVLRLDSQLVEKGADPWTVACNLEESYTDQRLKLLGEALVTLQISMDGCFASMAVTQEMLKKTGADIADSDEFATYPRSIRGVEMAALFREFQDGRVKVSLRSKSDVNVAEIARRYGGGGHFNAAGFSIQGDLTKAKTVVEQEAKKALK
jgi:phosphoesterase RecJ-like protein